MHNLIVLKGLAKQINNNHTDMQGISIFIFAFKTYFGIAF